MIIIWTHSTILYFDRVTTYIRKNSAEYSQWNIILQPFSSGFWWTILLFLAILTVLLSGSWYISVRLGFRKKNVKSTPFTTPCYTYTAFSVNKVIKFIFFQFLWKFIIKCLDDDDNDVDNEVRRVSKTPDDSCGCTRHNSQRSSLPLPCPWIKHCSFFSSWLCRSLINAISLSFTNWLK